MMADNSTQEIMPGLTRAWQAEGQIVVWTFAPPPLDATAMSLSNTYYRETLLPLAKAWKNAVRELLGQWPNDQVYRAVHACPTLGELIGPTALSNLAALNLRNIWLEPKSTGLPTTPACSRLAVILDPQLSARFNWRETEFAPGHVYELFLAANPAMYTVALMEALGWVAMDA